MMIKNSLLGDINRPEDIANVALFLVSNKARLITGTEVDAHAVIPGGMEYWQSFVKTRKDALARKEPAW